MTDLRKAALEWYRDEASALAKHMQSGAHSQAVLASLTVLSLDAGRRAGAALAAQRKPLTDEEILMIGRRALDKCYGTDAQHVYIAREVERALGITE